MPKAAIIMGSASDMPVVEGSINTLRQFGVEVEVLVCSAHRTPDIASEFSRNAQSKGIDVIIAAAGKAAHLPGVIAAYTTLPVIGLPVKSSFMDGLDSLLSIVQMPPGVPVATVAVNGSENAAVLAVQMMALKYSALDDKLKEYKETMKQKVIESNNSIQ
ncbi:MAG: 5-(carboxyamino)imidazole ribonucleotide mutase [Clostridia bacterium]|nr:5-(carboxyamino)imidazole ribonucleotide mutase [Clostridia bacterium]